MILRRSQSLGPGDNRVSYVLNHTGVEVCGIDRLDSNVFRCQSVIHLTEDGLANNLIAWIGPKERIKKL